MDLFEIDRMFLKRLTLLTSLSKFRRNGCKNYFSFSFILSSSFLEFGLHQYFHPHVWYTDSFTCETKLLKDVVCNYDIPYNFINLDIQGAELKALKGMEEYLPNIDYIYSEVNSDYVYKDCALIGEVDEYLEKFGLKRVETQNTEYRWGDAFYVRI
jgi:hypothetical protein